MHLPSSVKLVTLGLALGSAALAQNPAAVPPAPPAGAQLAAVPSPASALPIVTQSSRVRAFNAGPGGEVRSLYLQDGSVVNLTPALGGQLGAIVRKGEKISVTGAKSQVYGQSIVEAASIEVNDHTFSANSADPGPAALAQGPVPPPPGAAQAPAPVSARRNKAASSIPCTASDDAPPPPPDFGGPPPPPPDGMAPPPPPPLR